MGKSRKQLIITGVLITVMLLLWLNTFSFLKKRSLPAQRETVLSPAQEQTEVGAVKADIVPLQQESRKSENLSWGRCPFSGKVYSPAAAGQVALKLDGIIWDKNSPVAIINDRVVKAGDKVDVFTVIEIRNNSVLLNDGIKDIELK